MTYTELLGLLAGVALILVSCLGYKLFYKKELIRSFDGWTLSFGGLGALLTILGAHMVLTLPIPAPNVFKNILFGGPPLVFGVLLLIAAIYLWRRGDELTDMLRGGREKAEAALNRVLEAARPASWIVFAIGLAAAGVAVGAFRNNIFGTAPSQEPVLGTVPGGLVTFYVTMSLYVLPALGALLAPLAVHTKNRNVSGLVWLAWLLGGIGLLLLGAFVFFAHIEMEYNFRATAAG
jgi:uncharacterized membrane protein